MLWRLKQLRESKILTQHELSSATTIRARIRLIRESFLGKRRLRCNVRRPVAFESA